MLFHHDYFIPLCDFRVVLHELGTFHSRISLQEYEVEYFSIFTFETLFFHQQV